MKCTQYTTETNKHDMLCAKSQTGDGSYVEAVDVDDVEEQMRQLMRTDRYESKGERVGKLPRHTNEDFFLYDMYNIRGDDSKLLSFEFPPLFSSLERDSKYHCRICNVKGKSSFACNFIEKQHTVYMHSW